jgi:hypothetical protein
MINPKMEYRLSFLLEDVPIAEQTFNFPTISKVVLCSRALLAAEASFVFAPSAFPYPPEILVPQFPSASQLVQVEDAQNQHFEIRDHCPSGLKKLSEQRISGRA